MKPVNNKSLLHFIFDQMEKLDKDEIDVNQAKAQTGLAKQANNALRYELEKAKVEISVREFNIQHGSNVEIRNAEGKDFE